MAITPAQKQARGLEVQPNREFLHISEGTLPKIPKGEAATYLPVLLEDRRFNEWYVMKAGTIVARDVAARGGLLVPANGGAAQTLDYTVNDVGYTVDLDLGNVNSADGTLVTAAKTTVATIAANLPIGFSLYHWYSGAMKLTRRNFTLQPDVSILNRGFIEMPITKNDQAGIDEGDLIQAGPDGIFVEWAPGGVADVAQIVGRVLWREDIDNYPGKEGLSKVRTVRGVGLAGQETDGVMGHLYAKATEAGPDATEFVRINLTLLG